VAGCWRTSGKASVAASRVGWKLESWYVADNLSASLLWQNDSTKDLKFKARTKDSTGKAKDRTKDWRFKAKARTKDCNFVLKDNQGPRPRTTSLLNFIYFIFIYYWCVQHIRGVLHKNLYSHWWCSRDNTIQYNRFKTIQIHNTIKNKGKEHAARMRYINSLLTLTFDIF